MNQMGRYAFCAGACRCVDVHRRSEVIRQAISCDICGAEKKQTNHWFVACEQGGEMRVSGWNSRNRLRAGSKHLCGQTCLHKLLDEFLARTIEGRPAPDAAVTASAEKSERVNATTTANEAPFEDETPAVPGPVAVPPERIVPAAATTLPFRPMEAPRPIVMPHIEENAADAARRRRAEAWERERAREVRVVERRLN